MRFIFFTMICTASLLAESAGAEPPGAGPDRSIFAVCTNGVPACSIVIAGLGDNQVPQGEQERQAKTAQLLQLYLMRLSGIEIPMTGLQEAATNGAVRNAIVLDTEYPPSPRGCYWIRFGRQPNGGLIGAPGVRRMGLYIDADGPDCGRLAISNFVEKAFGPPLSAIDDPNYKWPNRPTLVIDADKFQPIQFPPANPKDWTQAK